MARLPRLVVPGQPHHVIQRGNNRCAIFGDPFDRKYFLAKLAEYAGRFEVEVHAYVLMTNHVHLLLTPTHEHSIPTTMQALGRSYVPYFNQRYGRTGGLWQGRYRAALIDSESYLLTCMRYIEMNPVRAGMVARPIEFAWSSYHCNATASKDELVTPHSLYQALGRSDLLRAQAYRALFDDVLSAANVNAIRDATHHDRVLGDAAFQTSMTSMTGRHASPGKRGGDRRSASFMHHRINGV